MKKIKQITDVQEVKVSYKKNPIKVNITCVHDADEVIKEIFARKSYEIDLNEYFFVLFLNRANNVISITNSVKVVFSLQLLT